ncbi:MAG: alanine--glyoxylate aminotransferase family protein [Theionarchaea archaeon]|nr:alanine--glyoxylate aminotransferase family protein [Theionarchaea archaeon]
MHYERAYNEVYEIVKPKYKLFTAGPVACFPEVLNIMNVQMFSHRSKEYKTIHMDTVKRLAHLVDAEKGEVLLFPNSGTGIMELCIRNSIPRGEKVLVTSIGAFGSRFNQVVESNGRKSVLMEFEPGRAVHPEDLDAALHKNPDVKAVTITHNETSSGVLNPLPDLAKVAKEHEKLLFVDAVSAMGGTDIQANKWGIDVVFSSSQKAFGVPPGLAIGVFSEEFLERAQNAEEKGWYFDVLKYVKYQKEKQGTPSTPPMPQIFGFNVALRILEQIGGKEKWFNMYRQRSEMVQEGISEIGLKTLAEKGYESPTITAVLTPNGITGDQVYEAMRARNIELAKGYGTVKEKTFRIGNMGYIPFEDIEEMLENLREVMDGLTS